MVTLVNDVNITFDQVNNKSDIKYSLDLERIY